MSSSIKTILASCAAFFAAPVAYLKLASLLYSLLTALGADVNYSSNEGGAFALLFVVFPLLAVLGSLTALTFTLPSANFARWKKTICSIAQLLALPLLAVVPVLVSAEWSGRVAPPNIIAYLLAYAIIIISSSLPAAWSIALAWWCSRK